MSLDIVTLHAKGLPARLRQLHQVPTALYIIGQPLDQALKSPVLSVVGSRKVSRYGRSITTDLVQQAVKQNIIITSGLALGVDSIAHQAAIDAGGRTIAVLPSGIKKIYPSSHTGLARSILLKQGTLVSEYGEDSLPMHHQFIERNRIIAALGDGLLVTEAAENSGSLHTARFALELGRTVMAVPGNIDSPTSAGTNNLIKMGATPVTGLEDILEALKIDPVTADKKTKDVYGDDETETKLLQLLSGGVNSGNELLTQSALSTTSFQQCLTMLEIKGRIKPLGNDQWTLS